MTTLGLVLSGGSTRGAYEAGVLGYIFGPLTAHATQRPRFDVISGTSVGAVHAAAYASLADDPALCTRMLREAWEKLRIRDVLKLGLR